jgi:xylose isomerase
VKFLEDAGYDGPRHFDAHAYRTENYEGVKDFAVGCMRSYLILKEKAARFGADKEIQGIVKELTTASAASPGVGKFSGAGAKALLGHNFDRGVLAAKNLPYERLDQLTMEVIYGVR